MSASFGERLKAQRERQQVSLETIAELTKLRVGLLEALERDDLSQWPNGIFRRSYLRSYAAAIGLEPEAAVRELVALYPEPVDVHEPTLEATELQRSARRPPMRLQYLIASAVGALAQPFVQKSRSTDPVSANSIAPPRPTPDTAADDMESGFAAGADVGQFEGASPTMASTDVDQTVDITAAPLPPLDDNLTLVGRVDIDRSSDLVRNDEAAGPDTAARIDTARTLDLPAMAQLCTRIVESRTTADLEPLLAEACRILHAVGIIVWPWDSARSVLWPSFSHGYPRQMLAKLPTLAHDADNLIGAAFRSSTLQVIHGGGAATSAIVAPLITAGGCTGVLAVECASGLEMDPTRQALATILAAQLSPLLSAGPMARSAIA